MQLVELHPWDFVPDCVDDAHEAAMLERFQDIDNPSDACELPYVSGIMLTVLDKPHITAAGSIVANRWTRR